MTALPPLDPILNDTAGNAVPVNTNFGTIATHVTNELINRDGSVAMTAPLSLAAPTADSHAVRRVDLDAVIPVGVMWDYGGDAAPTNWMLCDGTLLDQTTYADLYAAIGDAFNTGGEGGTQFRLPDFTHRTARAPGPSKSFGTGVPPPTYDYDVGTTNDLAQSDLTTVTHRHFVEPHSHSTTVTSTGTLANNMTRITTAPSGGTQARLAATTLALTGNAVWSTTGGVWTGEPTNRLTQAWSAQYATSSLSVSGTGVSDQPNVYTQYTGNWIPQELNWPPYLIVNKIIKVL